MQNKPNFIKAQMNANKVLTRDYENETLGEHGKNKPNSNPIRTRSGAQIPTGKLLGIPKPGTNFYTKNPAHRLQLAQNQKEISLLI